MENFKIAGKTQLDALNALLKSPLLQHRIFDAPLAVNSGAVESRALLKLVQTIRKGSSISSPGIIEALVSLDSTFQNIGTAGKSSSGIVEKIKGTFGDGESTTKANDEPTWYSDDIEAIVLRRQDWIWLEVSLSKAF